MSGYAVTGKVRNDGLRRVLEVREQGGPVTAPPFHQVPGVGPAGEKNVEKDRTASGRARGPRQSGCYGMEGPRRRGIPPSGSALCLDFLRTTRVDCRGTDRAPPEEEEGEETEGEEGGPGLP